MKINEEVSAGVAVMHLSGKIMGGDPGTLFHGRIRELINTGVKNFVIDLQKVDWINSVGLGMLISSLATVSNAGGKLVLANIDNVESILTLTRLISVFKHFESIDEAREAVAGTVA